MEENIKLTCLHDRHVALGAKMSPFAGFDMPIQYSGITEEHIAVRTKVGVFDVSHMGEITLKGSNALATLNKLLTNDFCGMYDGQARYSPMCNFDGGTVEYTEIDDDEYCKGTITLEVIST